jgi:hypothetical protein
MHASVSGLVEEPRKKVGLYWFYEKTERRLRSNGLGFLVLVFYAKIGNHPEGGLF